MKLIRLFLFIAVIFCSCKQRDAKHLDPNKQVDEGSVKGEVYNSPDIGWTITIPTGWTVVSRDQTDANDKKGSEAMKKAYKGEINMSKLKHLISFQKDKFNVFMSTYEPFKDGAEAYEQNCLAVNNLIYETYTQQGIKSDTSSGKELIHGHYFRTFYATLYAPGGQAVLRQILYSRLINEKDFTVTLNYNNEKDKEAMMDAWKNSTISNE